MTLQNSILESLDAYDARLWPFIPELLKDLCGLGSDPMLIERMLSEHKKTSQTVQAFWTWLRQGRRVSSTGLNSNRHALGVDGMPAFIEEAERAQPGHEARCRFEVADIRTWSSMPIWH